MVSQDALRQNEAQREEERERERIRRQFARAGRSGNKSAKQQNNGSRKGGGTFRMPRVGRSRRAPLSASQFHFHAKKSRASGASKSPVSCVNKVKYDLGLDEKDPHKDRVKVVFVAAPEGTPTAAHDPLKMAEACFQRARQSKYANSNTGQMTHYDTALPNFLSDDQLAKLADQINSKISEKFGVPSFSGVHLDRGNYHTHSSVPLYEVHDDGTGGFYLGDRINHAKRPQEREALGLPKSPATELRQLRAELADLIADSIAQHHANDPDQEAARHQAERWRHGHLTLGQQVEKAAIRGDIQFVLDNLNREATRKEGPAPTSSRREAAIAHNKTAGKPSEIPAPELITKTLAQRVVSLAEQAKLGRPEQLRLLAKKCGLNVHWSAGQNGNVQGVSYSIHGGPRIAGGRIGASLGTLQNRLGWAERPEYKRFPPKSGDQVMDFKRKLIEAKLEHVEDDDYVARSIKITLFRLKKLKDQAHENALDDRPATPDEVPAQDAQAAPGEAGALVEPAQPEPVKQAEKPVKVRPTRKSNDPSYNKGKGNAHAGLPANGAAVRPNPSQPTASNPKALMAELASIPSEPTKAPQKQAVRRTTLTPDQRELLARAWDDEQSSASGSFYGPLGQAREQLEVLEERLRAHRKAEPWPSSEYKKKFFGGRKQVETSQHHEWREKLLMGINRVGQLELKISGMIDKATSDTKLLQQLPTLEAEAAEARIQHQAQLKADAARRYENAISTLSTARPDSHEARRAYDSISSAIRQDRSLAQRERERRAERFRQEVQSRFSGTMGAVQRERPR